ELLHGDPLIAANRRFSVTLDGIYQRGEIYLRILQRLSSLAFGTAPGRWLTRFVALPLGGAFFILGGLQFLIDDVVKLFGGSRAASDGSPADGEPLDADTDAY